MTPKQTTFEGDFRMEERGAPLTELIEELYGSDVWPETVDGEPLAEKAFIERGAPLVGQHPANLLVQDRRDSQPALGRQVQQRLVGDAAPEEEREA